MPSNRAEMGECDPVDIVSSILNGSPFKIRTDEEKLAILSNGRPLPKLNIIKKDNVGNCNRTFQSSWYNIHKWLCGSLAYNKLFCWPCVLMRPETSSWCSTGIDEMKRISSLTTRHSLCKLHLKAISEFDETLAQLGLPREFVKELNMQSKEDETVSDDSEDDFFSFGLKEKIKDKKKDTESLGTTKSNSVSVDLSKTDKDVEVPKVKTKITFKAWNEMSQDRFQNSKTQFMENYKLQKWKRKIAKQELRNARLTGEKIKYEIEVLKAKADYYKFIMEEIAPHPVDKSVIPQPLQN